MSYTYQEAYKASLDYFDNDDLAAKVFVDKYALRNGDNELVEKTPEDMHWRIASELARIEKKKFKKPLSKEEIFEYLDRFRYIVPQGSPMYGIGNNHTYQSLGNCFTLGEHPYDSYGGIMYADQMLVQLCKRRCGVGLRLDNIRPKGLPTKNAAGTTDGIAVFMERFSNSTREVAQSGRRGALLEGLSVHHPEIETFINIKKDLTKVTGANISVLITDEFMKALKNNEEYEQRWPVDSLNPKITRIVSAKKIWSQIIDASYNTAEPGVLYIDTAQKYSLSHGYQVKDRRFFDAITNPCGEIFMGSDSCRLTVLNLASYVENPYTDKSRFDYQKFGEHCKIAQRFMDDIVDLEIEKIDNLIRKIKSDPEDLYIKRTELDMWKSFKEVAELGRRTGLGLTALGDCLASLNLRYGDDKSLYETEKIYKSLAINSLESSCLMAQELGPFPLYDKLIESQSLFLKRLLRTSKKLKCLHDKYGRRNISITTSAPCGSVSILTRTTSGIEPAYLLEYTRRRKIRDGQYGRIDFVDDLGDKWEENNVRHHGLQKWMDITGKNSIEDSPYHKATSNDVDWVKSVEIQALAQKWISHSVSKTANTPNNIEKSVYDTMYMMAYEKGCKGFTAYRDGCRSGVLIDNNSKKDSFEKTDAPKRPKELKAHIHHTVVKGKPYIVFIGLLDDEPYEVFAGLNTAGYISKNVKDGRIIKVGRPKCYKFLSDDGTEVCPLGNLMDDNEQALTRMTSTALRHGAKIDFVYEQLDKTSGDLTSFAKSIARALKQYLKNMESIKKKCYECGSNNLDAKNCLCMDCGTSSCA